MLAARLSILFVLAVPRLGYGSDGSPDVAASARSATGAAQALARADVVAEVRVHGNHSMPDGDVLAIAGIAVGDTLEAGATEEIQARLRASGRFESVEVRKRYRSLTGTGELALILVVHERAGSAGGSSLAGGLRTLASRLMFLPMLDYTEGYGFTYGGRVALVDLVGADGRLSVPLTWGGTRRAAIELDKDFGQRLSSSLQTGLSVSSRENPHFEIDDRRLEVWAQAGHEIVTGVRLSLRAGWTDVEFAGLDDRFATYALDLSVDTSSDTTFPRDAIFASVGWEAMDLLDDGPTIGRPRVHLRGYRGLLGQAVLSVQALYHGADRSLPSYQQPLLGGAGTMRGQRVAGLAGDNLALASVEVRVPLTSPMGLGQAGVSVLRYGCRVRRGADAEEDQIPAGRRGGSFPAGDRAAAQPRRGLGFRRHAPRSLHDGIPILNEVKGRRSNTYPSTLDLRLSMVDAVRSEDAGRGLFQDRVQLVLDRGGSFGWET